MAFAMVSGAMAALALPPFHFVPVLVISFGIFLWLIPDRARYTDSAFAGWAFGFGFFLAGLYWIGNSFLVDAERTGWLAAPAVFALSALLAVFTALAAVMTSWLRGAGLGRAFALAIGWTAAEWLRGHVLSGFPWNLIGYVWAFSDSMIQPAAAVGIYGLSLLTVLLTALPATGIAGGPARRGWSVSILALVGVAAIWMAGEMRLGLAGPDTTEVRVRIVQGNVAQALKWEPRERQRILDRYIDLSRRQSLEGVRVVIWPETALPFSVSDGDEVTSIVDAVPRGGYLLTGAVRVRHDGSTVAGLWNSLVALGDDGRIRAVYDKMRLVPFGEYVPFRTGWPLKKLTHGDIDFSAGSEPRAMDLEGLPTLRGLICYEAIFPSVGASEGGRPKWLVNVSNDAWFGVSSGPYQHFAMARVRAVEEGLPLVRAANTGVSAVVDAYGRILARLDLNQAGAIDADLPRALDSATPFSRFGDTGLAIMLLAGWLIVGMSRRRSRLRLWSRLNWRG